MLFAPRTAGAATAPPATPVTPTADEVDACVKRGVKFLWSIQKPTGAWEESSSSGRLGHNWVTMEGDTWGGFTSLAVFALLSAGESPSDPRMVKAINFLKQADIVGVYSLGLRCEVWSMLSSADSKAHLLADVRRLSASLHRSGTSSGLFGYYAGQPGPDIPTDMASLDRIDHSVSQYGVLGLWSGAMADIPVAPEVWKLMNDAWRRDQCDDGSWDYGQPTGTGTPSMTAAGVASLFIISDMLRGNEVPPPTGNYYDAKIQHGINWMAAHFNDVAGNYTWFGVERIGTASGYHMIGTTDWYVRGSTELVAHQQPEGSWDASQGGAANGLTETAFALLFLTHGRAPLVANKLDYSIGDDGSTRPFDAPWNQRHRDIANLAAFAGHTLEARLNWQIVNFATPIDTWHDAPILYIAGNRA